MSGECVATGVWQDEPVPLLWGCPSGAVGSQAWQGLGVGPALPTQNTHCFQTQPRGPNDRSGMVMTGTKITFAAAEICKIWSRCERDVPSALFRTECGANARGGPTLYMLHSSLSHI